MDDERKTVEHARATRAALVAILIGAGLCVGCSSSPDQGPIRTVSLAEFAASDRHLAADASENAEADEQAQDDAASEQRSNDNEPAQRVQVPLGASSQPAERQQRSEPQRVVVDSLVGQVNGRPIFANEFFAPIEDQLLAIRRQVSSREFLSQATPIITEQLRQIVLNELFLAEAEAGLTEQEQQGLFAWMRHMRDVTIAESGGSRTATRQRLAEQEGVSLDDYIASRRDMVLIQQLRRDKIEPRVIVAWRDVQREYERRWEEFNPPATLKLTRIRIPSDDEDTIAQVNDRLAAGESFAAIAQSLDQPDGESWQSLEMGPGGIDDIALAESIKSRIAGLEVGQTSEPFELGSSTWWLHIADIEQEAGRDLYDPQVQRQLSATLRNRRFNEEMNRYINTLFEQGVYDEIETMMTRLLEIAAVRYGQ